MAIFSYLAKDSTGRQVRGQENAENQAALTAALQQRGWQLVTANVYVPSKNSFNDKFEAWQGVPVVQKIFFTQNLGVMLRGGFSISRAMGTIARQISHRYFHRVILGLQSDLEAGVAFSQALGKFPHVFSEIFINMIAAGEVSGKLDDVLKELTAQMKKDHQLTAKVKGSMTYPIVILVAMVGAGVAMITLVVPKIKGIFAENKVKLPLPTRVLIAISDFLQHQWLWAIIGLVALIAIMIVLFRIPRVRWGWDAFILKMPIASTIIKKINLARFTRSLSSMLSTDIPIIQAFQVISRTMSSLHYRRSMDDSAQALKSGQSIARVLEKYPALYPPLVQQMISVGEESGTLDEVAGELAVFYEEEVDQTMSNLSTIIEPVILLIMGVAVAVMALAVMLPIYSLSNAIA